MVTVRAAYDEVEEGVLALDVEVQRALRHAERLGDVRHLHAAVPLFDEYPRRTLDELAEAIGWGLPSHAQPHDRLPVSTGVRFHPGELLLSLPVRLAAVAALGPSPVAVVVFELVFTMANLVEHGDIDLPLAIERRIGRVCVTPALHRRHHSQRGSELNSNFGTIFAWWDRLLGTYTDSSSHERIETGLDALPETPGIGGALILPLRLYMPRG